MLRTFVKVYMELGSYFLFLQEHIKDIIISRMTAVIVLYTHTHTRTRTHFYSRTHTYTEVGYPREGTRQTVCCETELDE